MSANQLAVQPGSGQTTGPASPPTNPGTWALNLIGAGAILALCYFAEEVLVVLLIAILIAFVLAPIVDLLMRFRIPRGIAAAIAVLLLLSALGGTVYFSYNQGTALMQDLPKYAAQIREEIAKFTKKAESLEVLNPGREKGVINVRQTTNLAELATRGFGSVSQAMFAGSFIPFLVYFMLTWQEHARSATVMLFPLPNRHTAYTTLGLISAMIRSFMTGNVLIALFIGTASTAAFGALHIPFFYFVGFVSGFLSLVPYLGVLLAIAPPVFVGLGHLSSTDFFYIVVTVVGLHVIALNILYPKFLGTRLQLNPLAVTISLLIWAWLWGAVGLVLAIPLTAAMKIIFDHVESLKPFGAWLGE